MGILYVVATPIGNLEDITIRAVRILQSVSLIAAEDTRHAQILKKRFDLTAPLTSYFEHNKEIKADVILTALEKGDVAIVSDAGTPAVSDPGVDIVRKAREAGYKVSPIPGPSALTAAISAAGIAAPSYLFLGFLPTKSKERTSLWERLKTETSAVIIYEAPHRISRTLQEMASVLEGNREIAILRELTKLYEEIFYGKLQDSIDWSEGKKGEFVLVLAPVTSKACTYRPEDVVILLKKLKTEGLSAKEASTTAAEISGLSKKDLYKQFLQL